MEIITFLEEYAALKKEVAIKNNRLEELSKAIKNYMKETGAKNYNIAASGVYLSEGREVSAFITYPSISIVDTKDVIELQGQEFFNKNAKISISDLKRSLTEDQVDRLVKKIVSDKPTLNIKVAEDTEEAPESEIPDLGTFE